MNMKLINQLIIRNYYNVGLLISFDIYKNYLYNYIIILKMNLLILVYVVNLGYFGGRQFQYMDVNCFEYIDIRVNYFLSRK